MALKVAGLEIKNLIDDEECYKQVRQLRWPNEIICPHCESESIKNCLITLAFLSMCTMCALRGKAVLNLLVQLL